MTRVLLISALLLLGVHAQQYSLCVQPLDEQGTPLQCVTTANDIALTLPCTNLPAGNYRLVLSCEGYQTQILDLKLSADTTLSPLLSLRELKLETTQVQARRDSLFGYQHLNHVDDMGLYAGKKNEVITPGLLGVNLTTNNARQVFGRVPGLNIWESDGAGLQMAIGGRGLNPNRMSSFNLRQNHYDISADALGYPDSYYTPPLEAVDRIVLVRGAAGLQYGPQFGGMINFKMKQGPADRAAQLTLRHTTGSWNLQNTFISLGGQPGTRLNYYGYYQHKTGDSWRPNSEFRSQTGYVALRYRTGIKTELTLDYTRMHYLARQAGGLTDVQFAQNPTQSLRARNWFQVDWNLAGLTLDHRISDRTRMRYTAFGLVAGRQALGNLDRINMIDLGEERTLIDDSYQNVGAEARLMHRIQWADSLMSTLLVGTRVYRGRTQQQQGLADRTDKATFAFLNPGSPDNCDYLNPSDNVSLFAENSFFWGSRFTITPGFRLEYLNTRTLGYYNIRVEDYAGNLISSTRVDDENGNQRTILLLGLGSSYKVAKGTELYANLSQNYRPINFNDIRIQNPNQRIDPNLQDERGYNADLGLRGTLGEWLTFDVSAFALHYANRIGQVLRSDEPPLYLPTQYRTNVGTSRTMGLEAYAEVEVWHWFLPKSKLKLLLYTNSTVMQGTYLHSDLPGVEGKQVEFAPPVTLRSGLSIVWQQLRLNVQHSYVATQYTDATNARTSASAVVGEIPAYSVADISGRYQWRMLRLEAGINNLLDAVYFTRRATSYPGPGIIPSSPRSFYAGLELVLSTKARR